MRRRQKGLALITANLVNDPSKMKRPASRRDAVFDSRPPLRVTGRFSAATIVANGTARLDAMTRVTEPLLTDK